jgi:hypothetical protein
VWELTWASARSWSWSWSWLWLQACLAPSRLSFSPAPAASCLWPEGQTAHLQRLCPRQAVTCLRVLCPSWQRSWGKRLPLARTVKTGSKRTSSSCCDNAGNRPPCSGAARPCVGGSGGERSTVCRSGCRIEGLSLGLPASNVTAPHSVQTRNRRKDKRNQGLLCAANITRGCTLGSNRGPAVHSMAALESRVYDDAARRS